MKAINIKFPIGDDYTTNRLFKLNHITKESISSNLLLLFLTEKGERYYMPDYGSNFLTHIFNPKDEITVDIIKEDLSETVSKYMPQITINEVLVNHGDDDLDVDNVNELNLKIIFTYSDGFFSEGGEIELTF